jgi:hypothetical protein
MGTLKLTNCLRFPVKLIGIYHKLGVTKKLDKLKFSEQGRFEDVVDADLYRQQGYQSHPELKLPAKI